MSQVSLKRAIKKARARAKETGEAQVVIEDAEEPGYYHIVSISGYPYSLLGTVVSIEYPSGK